MDALAERSSNFVVFAAILNNMQYESILSATKDLENSHCFPESFACYKILLLLTQTTPQETLS